MNDIEQQNIIDMRAIRITNKKTIINRIIESHHKELKRQSLMYPLRYVNLKYI